MGVRKEDVRERERERERGSESLSGYSFVVTMLVALAN